MSPTFTLPQIVAALNAGFQMAADAAALPITQERFTWPMAATLAHLEGSDLKWSDVTALHDAVADVIGTEGEIPAPDDDGCTWSRAQVADAVNWAVDEAADHVRHGACADDIDNFAVNAVLTLLDDPNATFEDIVRECYGEHPSTVGSWLASAA